MAFTRISPLLFLLALTAQTAQAGECAYGTPDNAIGAVAAAGPNEVRVLSEAVTIRILETCNIAESVGQRDPKLRNGARVRFEMELNLAVDGDSPVTVPAALPVIGPLQVQLRGEPARVILDGAPLEVAVLDRDAVHEPFRVEWEAKAREYLATFPEYEALLAEKKERIAAGEERFDSFLQAYVAEKLGLERDLASTLYQLVLGKHPVGADEFLRLMCKIDPGFVDPLATTWRLPADWLRRTGWMHLMGVRLHTFRLALRPGEVHRLKVVYDGLTYGSIRFLVSPSLTWSSFGERTVRIEAPVETAPRTRPLLARTKEEGRVRFKGKLASPGEDLLLHLGGIPDRRFWAHSSSSPNVADIYRRHARPVVPDLLAALEVLTSPAAREVILFDSARLTAYADLPWDRLMPLLWSQCMSRDWSLRSDAVRVLAMAPGRHSAYALVQLLSHRSYRWVPFFAETALERLAGHRFSRIPGRIDEDAISKWQRWLAESEYAEAPDWFARRVAASREHVRDCISRLDEGDGVFRGDPVLASVEAEFLVSTGRLEPAPEWKRVLECWAGDTWPAAGASGILQRSTGEGIERLARRLPEESMGFRLKALKALAEWPSAEGATEIAVEACIGVLKSPDCSRYTVHDSLVVLRKLTGYRMQNEDLSDYDVWVRDSKMDHAHPRPFTEEQLAERKRVIEAWLTWHRSR